MVNVEGGRVCAAVDIGSNSIKLRVGRCAARGVQVLLDTTEVVRLGSCLRDGAIPEETMRNAARVVAEMVDRARRKNVLGIVASILVFLGIVFLGVLVVPYLGDGFRCALMYLVSLAFLVLGFALSLRRRSPLSLAVLGTGAGALFISVLMTRVHFGPDGKAFSKTQNPCLEE